MMPGTDTTMPETGFFASFTIFMQVLMICCPCSLGEGWKGLGSRSKRRMFPFRSDREKLVVRAPRSTPRTKAAVLFRVSAVGLLPLLVMVFPCSSRRFSESSCSTISLVEGLFKARMRAISARLSCPSARTRFKTRSLLI
ncbi:hypothetical protein SDC9_81788 [bioreactor metagenome]|uniref:Uncharacterized protein n=1 Tax=bioreactor metagenome TaxID=1076179 RepID=A0A644Z4K0_9ZZZZ